MQTAGAITFLVASDTHLGYKEKDPIRGKDSFKTFGEVLKIANENKVDFVLLGGDLFHQNRPSYKTMHDCMEIMKENCLGSRACTVEVISNQKENFGHTSRTVKSVNYENPNINVSMPVFSIHGNHDDPATADSLSAIDLLSVPGLLNHFGKASGTEYVRVKPVLLKKGNTTIALYGLGAIHDERLYSLFLRKKVEFEPAIANSYNIMVIHQNRYERGQRRYIPENFLEGFFDLVIWGHEHECITSLSENEEKGFSVLQPGSSVATKLIDAESKKKHAFLFNIHKRKMNMTPIELNTTRILQFETIRLEDGGIASPDEYGVENKIIAHCEEKVREMIAEAKQKRSRSNKQPELPLIRLRVDYSGGYPTFDRQSFGRRFKKQIANPDDSVIRFILSHQEDTRSHGGAQEPASTTKVEDLILEYLKDKNMTLLSPSEMGRAVTKFGEDLESGTKSRSKDVDAISIFCEENLNKVCLHLKELASLTVEENAIAEEIKTFASKNRVEMTAQSDGSTPASTTPQTSEAMQHTTSDSAQSGRISPGPDATSSSELPSNHSARGRKRPVQKTIKDVSSPFSRMSIATAKIPSKNPTPTKQKKPNAGKDAENERSAGKHNPTWQAGLNARSSPHTSAAQNIPPATEHDSASEVIMISDDSDDSMNNDDDVAVSSATAKQPRFGK